MHNTRRSIAATQRKPLPSLMLRASIKFLLSLCIVTIAFGADIRSIEVERDGVRYRLVSMTHFESPQQDVFDALIDYDQLAAISETIKESRYLDPAEDGEPLVFTRLGACVLFYCQTVEKVERLEFDTPCYIATTALPERSDVRYSRSEWTLAAASGGGTDVTYRLEFEPDFWVPPIVGPMLIKRLLLEDGTSAVQEIEAMARLRAPPHDIANQ